MLNQLATVKKDRQPIKMLSCASDMRFLAEEKESQLTLCFLKNWVSLLFARRGRDLFLEMKNVFCRRNWRRMQKYFGYFTVHMHIYTASKKPPVIWEERKKW
jgi:hypothetical protein